MTQPIIDIREATLQEFEAFVFDHEFHPAGSSKVWYHQFGLVIHYNAQHNVRCFTELFKNAQSLLSKFDRLRLEQGCWAMFGAGFEGGLTDLIWADDVPVEMREDLIRSMFFLYRDLFSQDPLEHACEMWWDSLAYDINPMQRIDPTQNEDHKRIQNAMFDTLVKILSLDSIDCQCAALHGLNHVLHPDNVSVVKDFIERTPDLSVEEIEYAMACAKGQAA